MERSSAQRLADERAKWKAGEDYLIALWSVIAEDAIPSSTRTYPTALEDALSAEKRSDRLSSYRRWSERLYVITLSGGKVEHYLVVSGYPADGVDTGPQREGVTSASTAMALYLADVPRAQGLLDKYGAWMSQPFGSLDDLGIMVLGWYPDRTRKETACSSGVCMHQSRARARRSFAGDRNARPLGVTWTALESSSGRSSSRRLAHGLPSCTML